MCYFPIPKTTQIRGVVGVLFPKTTQIRGVVGVFSVVSKKVCKVNIILIFALSNKQQQEYGTYTRTNFGNYFELHK